jgi:hypothetical protein
MLSTFITPVTVKDEMRVIEAEAEIGRQYQPEFVDALASQGLNLLSDWLRQNAPAEISALFDQSIQLQDYARKLSNGSLDSLAAWDLVVMMPKQTRLIWNAGGVFSDGSSIWHKPA